MSYEDYAIVQWTGSMWVDERGWCVDIIEWSYLQPRKQTPQIAEILNAARDVTDCLMLENMKRPSFTFRRIETLDKLLYAFDNNSEITGDTNAKDA